jgi:hypothetical protein
MAVTMANGVFWDAAPNRTSRPFLHNWGSKLSNIHISQPNKFILYRYRFGRVRGGLVLSVAYWLRFEERIVMKHAY